MEEIVIRPYRPTEPSYVSYMQMRLYEKIYGYKPVFEYYLTAGMADFLRDTAGGQLWVAERGGEIVGSIAVVRSGQDEALLRWFAVEPALHGRGLGERLVETALAFCREKHYTHLTLWTESQLKAARHLYGKHGFVLTQTKENTEWTDHLIIEEKWEYSA